MHGEYVLFLTKGPFSGQICGYLHIFDQSFGRPTCFVVSKTTAAQKTESSPFSPKFKFFLGYLASNNAKGSNLFDSPLDQCHAKRFIQKRLYILWKGSKHSYFLLKFMYSMLFIAFENCQELKLIS